MATFNERWVDDQSCSSMPPLGSDAGGCGARARRAGMKPSLLRAWVRPRARSPDTPDVCPWRLGPPLLKAGGCAGAGCADAAASIPFPSQFVSTQFQGRKLAP